MPTRHLYVLRHGAADPFGELTGIGEQQADLIGRRLAPLRIGAVWHSPLSRADRTARIVHSHLADARIGKADELLDHVPHVPDDVPAEWAGFFDGFDAAEAAAGARRAESLIARFARPADADTHEVVITHAYPVAWLVRHALDAPPARWLGLNCGNTALTVIEYRDVTKPTLVLYNDVGHLPPELRWTGFRSAPRP